MTLVFLVVGLVISVIVASVIVLAFGTLMYRAYCRFTGAWRDANRELP